MAVKIRLSRGGTKKRPHYRIVIADARAPRDGSFIEKVGTYNPMVPKDHPERVTLVEERIKHWLSVGARPTERVHRLLANAELMTPFAYRPQTRKNKPKEKAQARLREAEERARETAAQADA